jgi:5-methylcytosine-specific restriction endonuclease McrA
MYYKHGDIQRSHERRRRARELSVQSEDYVEKDILNRWGTACYLCGEEIDLEAPRSMKTYNPRALHMDHVIPIALGGPDTIDNVKPTHSSCNLKRPKGRRKEYLASLSPEDKAKLTTFSGLAAERKLGRKLKD